MELDLPLTFALQVQPNVGETLGQERSTEEGSQDQTCCNLTSLQLRLWCRRPSHPLCGGRCQGQVDRAGKEVGDGGEAAPALKSQGYPGTSVRVTLPTWVPASGP